MYLVSKNDLLNSFVLNSFGLLVIKTSDDVLGINDGDDAVKLVHLFDVLVDEEPVESS